MQTGQNILLGAEQDPWLAGVRAYLQAHAYNTSASGQLWQALSAAAGRNVGAWMQGWTYRAGYPLVEVSLGGPQGRDLLLSQVCAIVLLSFSFSSAFHISCAQTGPPRKLSLGKPQAQALCQ